MFPRHNKLTICYLTACIAAASCTAVAANDDIAIDEHIEVRSKVQQRAFPTLPEARDELRKIAGGINLVELDKLPARQATLQDALGFEPGVMMQSFFGGNDQPRLNIRGSGVQSNPVNRGVQLLYDGLPINASDGSFVIGFLDPKSANMISVYRGANGLRYGATTLGGAINMMARNGTNSQSAIRAEYGSDNRLGASLQLAGQEKTWDYFLSAGSDSYDGYRHHSESERSNFSGNFGYAFSNNIYNRTYINYSDNTFEIPFVVPKARALADPKLVMGDGDTRWIHRGAYDLVDLDPDNEVSAGGMPRAKTLYGSLIEQLQRPDSFASQLKKILAVRRAYDIAASRQIMIPDVEHPGLLIMVHELPAGKGTQITALNFSAEPIVETLHLPGIAPGPVVDIINERVEGDLTEEGEFTITLDAYEGLALRVVSMVAPMM